MQRIIKRLGVTAVVLMTTIVAVKAQEDTTRPTSVDPKLLEWVNAKIPKEYTIASVEITGVKHLDTAIVASITNLQPGDKFMHPGSDIFAKAIANLWRQKFFSNVQIYITKLDDDKVWVEVNVLERPRLGNYKFIGIKKSEEEDIQGKLNLAKQTIILESTRKDIVEKITKHFSEKGFRNVGVRIDEQVDTMYANSNSMTIYVDKGGKVKINEIGFFGNENIDALKLKKQMKGTKEMPKITLYADSEQSPYGVKKKYSFSEYTKDWGFLSLSRTRQLLDPYIRFKFSGGKFNPVKFDEDKNKVLDYYNANGYRDAQIIADTQYATKKGNLNVDIKVNEGRKYYFGNIVWKGNAKYGDSILNNILGINKGDIYNLSVLNKRLGKEAAQEGGDISGLYMDDGYLFFRAEPVETAVYNDTIDHEIRIVEGPQARIKNVTIAGNEKTKDFVIRRELRTIPGELFSRTDLIRSQRELANLQFFNQETINPGVVPNADDGTVDINWKLEEKSSDQLELSAGWGGGVGLTGTLGVTFNNFSIRNITKRSSWDPLPTGDGQKLSLRVQSNGRAYRSYNFSFTEPWLGGKKRNSLTIGVNSSKFSNAFDYYTGTIDRAKSDTNYLKTTGLSIALGKQLKWPDDYFSLVYTLNFTQYKLLNYPIFDANFKTGKSNNISAKIAIQRSSVFDPIFPRSGSNFLASVQFTPPYSLFNKNIEKSNDKYKNPEYHKWRFNAEWYVPIGKPMGAEKNRQFVMKVAAKYGFMGRYNSKLEYSPFERFQVGDAGLTNNFGLLGYDIIAHRGYPVYQTSDPTINPDQQSASQFFTIFNKYQLELRYPLVTNPSSTIYALTFFEAANGWYNYKDYNPFKLRRSVGVGMRFFLPMFGLLGFDYGVGLDRIQPGQTGLKGASRFTFMLGFEPE
ncbi:MAG TPA: POTRA domain-containing protein [Chitinophagaceae bacterium]|nr:POTRA domain-containing protein [Chitinophagaceae bacterium]HMU56881.1 POTRA domain-containing protein [Chitinophagaceae bacterium]